MYLPLCFRLNTVIFIQLQSPKVERIMEILRQVKSSYYSSFKDVCLKVDEGKAAWLEMYYCFSSFCHSHSNSVNDS